MNKKFFTDTSKPQVEKDLSHISRKIVAINGSYALLLFCRDF